MSETLQPLQDIELAPLVSANNFLIMLTPIVILLCIMGLIWYWRRHNDPLKQSIKHLKNVPDMPVNPSIIAEKLLQGLSVKQLKNSSLPDTFIKRLESSRFSSTPCTSKTYISLKQEAIDLLQDIHEKRIK